MHILSFEIWIKFQKDKETDIGKLARHYITYIKLMHLQQTERVPIAFRWIYKYILGPKNISIEKDYFKLINANPLLKTAYHDARSEYNVCFR
jgi:hypothetical protein